MASHDGDLPAAARARAETRYMVLPARPPGTGHLGQQELASVVARNGLIGTAAV